jgi:hypothetical protein
MVSIIWNTLNESIQGVGMGETKPFKVGDRVVHHYGTKGEFAREDVVTKVHKTSNFKIANTDTQFRQTGQESGDPSSWHRGWVEHWTPELGELVKRKGFERRVVWNLKILMSGIEDISDENLGRLDDLLEDIKPKNKDSA